MKHIAIIVSCLLLACAPRTNVEPLGAATPSLPLVKPDRVLVYTFAVTPDEVALNSSLPARLRRERPRLLDILPQPSPTEQEIAVGRQVADALANELVARLSALGLPAERATGAEPASGRVLALEGQFVKVDEGNRAQRVVVGFGLGSSVISTRTQVYYDAQGQNRLLRTFETTAESSSKPGVSTTAGVGAAVGAGAAALGGAAAGLSERQQTVQADAKRTADELVKQLTPILTEQGWITPPGT